MCALSREIIHNSFVGETVGGMASWYWVQKPHTTLAKNKEKNVNILLSYKLSKPFTSMWWMGIFPKKKKKWCLRPTGVQRSDGSSVATVALLYSDYQSHAAQGSDILFIYLFIYSFFAMLVLQYATFFCSKAFQFLSDLLTEMQPTFRRAIYSIFNAQYVTRSQKWRHLAFAH